MLGALLTLVVVVGCGSGGPEAADGAGPPCGEAVLGDWADGSIDGVYPTDCYLAAIDALPEDVRVYTSAEDDITRAMQSRSGMAPGAGEGAQAASDRQLSAARPETAQPNGARSLRFPPAPVLILAGLGLALLGGGLTATATRRARRNG
ncbi:MAG TPA: hypothetical protein VMN35_08725 [Gaiellaceae bacterium]|nr:hypothetical protein [Gaiellaceae bacterium]